MDRDSRISIAVTIALSAGGIFPSFLPSIYEVRKKAEPEDRADVRAAEGMAAMYSIAIGVAGSVLVGNGWPLATSIALAAAMILLYELALNTGEVPGGENPH